jgi:hypothetical protein
VSVSNWLVSDLVRTFGIESRETLATLFLQPTSLVQVFLNSYDQVVRVYKYINQMSGSD